MIDIIFNHRSIRKYTGAPIPEHVLSEVLEAGTRASTTGNMQVYSIIVTTESSIKNKLWEYHFKQDMVKTAPVILTFCADFNRFNTWCKLRDAIPGYDNFLSFMSGAIDALLVAQNVAVAAEFHGLGICYLGTTLYMADSIIDLLELPKGVIPVTSIVAGYPDENLGLTDRLPLQSVIHYEKYRDYTETDIDSFYFDKEHSELTKTLLEENNKETLAQVFTDNRYTKKDNVAFSKKLLEVLKKQGFMNNE